MDSIDINMDRSKILILVTGTEIEPHDKNWKECEATWIPELRKLGYTVKVVIGRPKMKKWFKVEGDILYFKADDTKQGLVDKSIKLPAKWVLEETDYEYYFRIDSDSFVEPKRFDAMLEQNLTEMPELDYMGSCHPVWHWNPHEPHRFLVCRERHFASGCGYFVSKRAMKIALEHMRIEQGFEHEIDDWVLGRAMWENGVQLLHDGRVYFESKHKILVIDEFGIGIPDIADPNSHLALQHYMNGHMEAAMVSLGYRN